MTNFKNNLECFFAISKMGQNTKILGVNIKIQKKKMIDNFFENVMFIMGPYLHACAKIRWENMFTIIFSEN